MEQKKLQEVLSDEAFVKELAELDTPEEVQAKLREKGVDVSVEEIQQVGKALQSQAEGELDEDALEDVAGGSIASVVNSMTNPLTKALATFFFVKRSW